MRAQVLALFTLAFSSIAPMKAVSADPLVGMAQLSRSDGMLVFGLFGSFSVKERCEFAIKTFAANFRLTAEEAGHVGNLDAAFCDHKAPPRTEFAALQLGLPTKHYILFTPSMRLMMVHKRGNLDYERQSPELMRGQLFSKLNVEARCDAPLPEWLNAPN